MAKKKHFTESEFYHKGMQDFIVFVYMNKLRKKPNFKNMSEDIFFSLYGEVLTEVNFELMQHRQKPVNDKFLTNLREFEGLPKSSKIILNSISK
jgi:hypothetical protein